MGMMCALPGAMALSSAAASQVVMHGNACTVMLVPVTNPVGSCTHKHVRLPGLALGHRSMLLLIVQGTYQEMASCEQATGCGRKTWEPLSLAYSGHRTAASFALGLVMEGASSETAQEILGLGIHSTSR